MVTNFSPTFFTYCIGDTVENPEMFVFPGSLLFDLIVLSRGSILEPRGSIFGLKWTLGAPWGLPGEAPGPKRHPNEKNTRKVTSRHPPQGPKWEAKGLGKWRCGL